MNLVNSIGSLAMDGTRKISAETLKVVSSELQKSSTPIIVSPTGAEAAQDLVQTAAAVKADAQQLQKTHASHHVCQDDGRTNSPPQQWRDYCHSRKRQRRHLHNPLAAAYRHHHGPTCRVRNQQHGLARLQS